MKLIILSGRSGSGKSVALRALEDLGYYCVDNIPVNLLAALSHALIEDYQEVAVSVDVRNLPKIREEFTEILSFLPKEVEMTTIFLDASHDVLIKRFSDTRRLHPLSKEFKSLEEAISNEQQILEEIKINADLYIDTDELTVHQLAETIRERVLGKKSSRMVMVFESFGFKYGLPKDADYVFDVRFLPNPHWEPSLREYTGLDKPVQIYLESEAMVTKFIWQTQNFLSTWLPHLERNNRSFVKVAIGCTGGKHRSVFVAEQLYAHIQAIHPDTQIRHREMDKHHATLRK